MLQAATTIPQTGDICSQLMDHNESTYLVQSRLHRALGSQLEQVYASVEVSSH